MRLATSLVLGAASTALAFDAQVRLGAGDAPVDKKPLNAWDTIQQAITKAGSEAKALWDEVSLLAPDAVAAFKSSALSYKPKPANRRPDSAWDHVVKGADVEKIWMAGGERAVGGQLGSYNLRARKVDPSVLGVDSVKQYSGYLDDNENDKHLFYCRSSLVVNRPPGNLASWFTNAFD